MHVQTHACYPVLLFSGGKGLFILPHPGGNSPFHPPYSSCLLQPLSLLLLFIVVEEMGTWLEAERAERKIFHFIPVGRGDRQVWEGKSTQYKRVSLTLALQGREPNTWQQGGWRHYAY